MTKRKNYVGKEKLVNMCAERFGLTKKGASEKIENVQEFLTDILKKEDYDGIQLIGFVTLDKYRRAEREGVNPRTKEKINIPSKNVIKIKAGTDLDKKLNS